MNQFTVSRLLKQDIPQAAHILANSFMGEPMTQALRFTEGSVASVFTGLLQEPVNQGTVYCAMNKNNQIGSVCLCQDPKNEKSNSLPLFWKAKQFYYNFIDPIHGILDDLTKEYKKQKIEVEKVKIIEIALIGTSDKFQRLNLASKTYEFAENDLKYNHGFKEAFGEATNIKSETMFGQKYGYKKQKMIDYRTWRSGISGIIYLSRNPYKNIDKKHNLWLMDKKL